MSGYLQVYLYQTLERAGNSLCINCIMQSFCVLQSKQKSWERRILPVSLLFYYEITECHNVARELLWIYLLVESEF